jgi:hypothetical protein
LISLYDTKKDHEGPYITDGSENNPAERCIKIMKLQQKMSGILEAYHELQIAEEVEPTFTTSERIVGRL